MKNVFLLLLLVNVLLVSWAIWKAKTELEAKPVVETAEINGAVELELLNELSVERSAELGAVVVADEAGEAKPVVDEITRPLCKMIGPFSELLQAEYTVENLSALDVSAAIMNVDVPAEADYWVYLKPLSSQREAMTLLRELQVKSIDSYVFTKGELSNGISFGLFSRMESAQRRQSEVKALGYESHIFEQQKFSSEIWVVVDKEEATGLDQSTWLKFMSERKSKKIKENYCPSVASS